MNINVKRNLSYCNKKIGYEQGSTIITISDAFAEYALNLATTNIVLLVGIYKRG